MIGMVVDFLLSLVGVCRHEHYRRERCVKTHALLLVCEQCGRTVQAIERTKKEREAMAKQYPLVKPAATSSPKVVPIRKAKGLRAKR